jgi:hypothetical protein
MTAKRPIYKTSNSAEVLFEKQVILFEHQLFIKGKLKYDGWDFLNNFFCTLFNTSFSATPPLCWRMLGSNTGQLRLRHWLSDHSALDLFHNRLDLMRSSRVLTDTYALPTRIKVID